MLQKKQGPAEHRAIRLAAGEASDGFVGNDIKTAKYNLVTFLPIFLCEVFSRAAYLYFLLQVRDQLSKAHLKECQCICSQCLRLWISANNRHVLHHFQDGIIQKWLLLYLSICVQLFPPFFTAIF